MPHEPQPQPADELDAEAVRTWSSLALAALGRAREDIDAINVYPVADADTGTNLYLTAESADRGLADAFPEVTDGTARTTSLAEAVRAWAHGALVGARGNSGTILAQLLRGVADVLGDEPAGPAEPGERGPGGLLARALTRAAEEAYAAVAHPVEGTMLTVAGAAARAGEAAGAAAGTAAEVARAAYDGARAALAETPGQLAALGRAGVVDAGGCGLVVVFGALWQALSGQEPVVEPVRGRAVPVPQSPDPCAQEEDGPAYEVIYLLEASEAAVGELRERLDGLGDSLVVVGGDGLWNVHVHVDDPGAAVEAGVVAGRPYRIRITHFGDERRRARGERAQRAVVAVVPGEGLAGLCGEAGATTVLVRPGEPPAVAELLDAVRRAHAREVVLLQGGADLRAAAAAAAEQARAEGVRVAVIPTRSAVQGLAALAVHDPEGSFDEDVVAMTAAAGATRYGELAVAERQSFTSAGICQAGDVLGLIDGDVAVIGAGLPETAEAVLDRMLGSGGELVTLVLGPDVPDAVAERLEAYVQHGHLAVDTVTYRGGRYSAPLLIGVE
ncbi:DAK2 domain-containing protein [Streptomyces virginiae]|uniref:DAK2 domain-containing protein n=1 Tax=Streptomyces TaxID=1883 RepID=UPI0013707919|nr:DAK2 domain-containing protein [Streptomyces virginiae]MCX4716238.1 DAK2 domain-containing protein [Streptomyces virginiae]MYV77088.1 DAK2 domain-containing protein [Streptomyces sp. SID1046]